MPRIVKYAANRAAKNISSLDNHTTVPTLTMLGRSGGPCSREAGIAVWVATDDIMAVPHTEGDRGLRTWPTDTIGA